MLNTQTSNKTTISLPYNFIPRSYQMPVLQALDSGYKRAVIVWHRRSGKDKTILNYVIKQMYKRVGLYYYFFPTYRQGKKIIWNGRDKDGFAMLAHFPTEIIDSKNETDMMIKTKNGSIFQIIGTDNIDSIVGTNPIGCVFSEFSLQNIMAWDMIRPILAENNGFAIFIFTPRGKNHGWRLLQLAKQNQDKWFSQVLTVDDTGAIDEETLKQERKEMPDDLFKQEYYCQFIDDASSFFKRINENLWHGQLTIQPNRSYRLGIDLGKYQDFTVITPIDLHTWEVGIPERFNRMDWILQKAKIESMARRYNNAEIVIDSTGLGDPIVDDLKRVGLRVKPIKFTGGRYGTRYQLLTNLSIKLEQSLIKIPNYQPLIDELSSVEYHLSEVGNVKLGVPDGIHDDCVFSLALAVWELSHIIPVPIITNRFNYSYNTYNNIEDLTNPI